MTYDHYPVLLRSPPLRQRRGILCDYQAPTTPAAGIARSSRAMTYLFFITTTPALRATPSPAKGTFVRLHQAKGNFVRLSSTNHPVRLRFATARHPST
ncbi:MAG: hypothetical protein LBB23_02265 [Rickettsiales bacterium]|nr:hypothetical protein [Rickettsiales bacterium]